MNIWKVIQNGNSLKRTGRDRDGRVIILPSTTTDEHIVVQRESKARTTLLQTIPDDHVAYFIMDDARDIWNAVKARFGGNVESKKMRKSMLKQEFLEFRISEAEGLHKGYDRMQKILSQLNQLKGQAGEDINLKFLRALPLSWSQVALTLKTKGGLELLSFDDLYYKLKTLEVDIKGYSTFSSSQSAGPSHSAFVSTTSASKKMSYADSPSYSSSTYTAPSNSKTGSHRSGNKNRLEEMDLKWQMAMLSVRVHKFEQKAGRKIDFDKKESARFNKKKVRYSGDWKEGRRFKALITVDTLVIGQSHDGQGRCVIAPKEFGVLENLLSMEPKSNDSTSCASTSSVSTSESKAEIESNVGTPILEPIIVQDLPSFSCNSSDKNENTSRTYCNKNGYFNKKAGVGPVHSRIMLIINQFVHMLLLLWTGKVNIPPTRPQPVPTGKPKVPAPVPTGRQNRPFSVLTDRGYYPSVTSEFLLVVFIFPTGRPLPTGNVNFTSAAEPIPARSGTTTATPSSPVRDARKGKGVA
ncbi:hypothetical protein Tco_0998804, partial [Tanacetum coccineum]